MGFVILSDLGDLGDLGDLKNVASQDLTPNFGS
jgi:hypothetical protein